MTSLRAGLSMHMCVSVCVCVCVCVHARVCIPQPDIRYSLTGPAKWVAWNFSPHRVLGSVCRATGLLARTETRLASTGLTQACTHTRTHAIKKRLLIKKKIFDGLTHACTHARTHAR